MFFDLTLPRERIELSTTGLQDQCSTSELRRRFDNILNIILIDIAKQMSAAFYYLHINRLKKKIGTMI